MTARIIVEYTGAQSDRIDAQITKLAGSRSTGGGYGLSDGVRDLEFCADDVSQAEWIAEKIRYGMPSTRVSVAAVGGPTP